MIRWAILTGEYPPQAGGVSDYTRQVAQGLAKSGDEIHVWAPMHGSDLVGDPGVVVHGLATNFGLWDLRQLGKEIDDLGRPCRLLVQYTPHSFGYKAMNLPFCLWLAWQRRPVWVMFHEVAYPYLSRQPWRHTLLAGVNRVMAGLLVRSAERLFVSIPGWEPLLRSLSRRCPPITWLPVPSNIPTSTNPVALAAVRQSLAPASDCQVLGHFGTFSVGIASMLAKVLPPVLREGNRMALLVGRGGETFAEQLRKNHPSLTGRLIATGSLPAEQVANHLAACDVLFQPYPDGASSRRTSLMSGLALGLPIATTEGFLTEPMWREGGAVALTPAGDADTMRKEIGRLLNDSDERKRLGERARALYESRFALGRTIEGLQR